MSLMSVTLDTSHFEMSALNAFVPTNIPLISVTLDTSHSPIGPCGPLEQSPFGNSLMHASTALLSCVLDRGKNAGSGVGVVCVTVPGGGGRAIGLSSRQVGRTGDSARVKV